MTALFVDLVGFTDRAEQMDVEDVRGLLEPYHALVRRELEERGGTLEKFVGDGVMAVFGAPTAHEDDPERAVRSALAIRDAATRANREDAALDLHLRIGICTGETLVTVDAQPAEGEAFAAGDVINTAARLQSAAPVDGVLVGWETYQATARAIEYEPVEAVRAKGKALPVQAWLVRGARSRLPDLRGADYTRLVDRAAERRAMLEAFERSLVDRSPRAVLLIGVPGIGKTRLVAELAERNDRRPELIRWRLGRAFPYGEPSPFAALSQIVRSEAGILDSDAADVAAGKLRAAVAEVIPDPGERDWIDEHLRPIAGVSADRPLVGDRRAEAFAAWRRLLEHLGRQRPCVFAFEDLHWADDALLDFIEHVVTWGADTSMLVVGTSRPELLERRPGWLAGPAVDRLVIEPLSGDDTSELVDAIAEGPILDEATRSAVVSHAAGNPLYAHEYVRLLGERADEAAATQAPVLGVASIPVPTSVRGIIAARLDALSPEQKATIQDAAVVGRVVWPGAVARVAGRSRWAVEETLVRLEARRLLRRRQESRVESEDEYTFEHSLIREVAYAGIVRAERSHKHAMAAEWLGEAAGARGPRIDAIADHLSAAYDYAAATGRATEELRAAAASALREAAARAQTLHSHTAAARLYVKALRAVRRRRARPRPAAARLRRCEGDGGPDRRAGAGGRPPDAPRRGGRGRGGGGGIDARLAGVPARAGGGGPPPRPRGAPALPVGTGVCPEGADPDPRRCARGVPGGAPRGDAGAATGGDRDRPRLAGPRARGRGASVRRPRADRRRRSGRRGRRRAGARDQRGARIARQPELLRQSRGYPHRPRGARDGGAAPDRGVRRRRAVRHARPGAPVSGRHGGGSLVQR